MRLNNIIKQADTIIQGQNALVNGFFMSFIMLQLFLITPWPGEA
jgi:hypothetical protein